MTESPHLKEEPQSERGAPGSRDQGGPPDAGPTDRPAGDPHTADATGVDRQGTVEEEMEEQPPS